MWVVALTNFIAVWLSSNLLVMTENNHITGQEMSSVDKYSNSVTLNIKHDCQANIFHLFRSINHTYTLLWQKKHSRRRRRKHSLLAHWT